VAGEGFDRLRPRQVERKQSQEWSEARAFVLGEARMYWLAGLGWSFHLASTGPTMHTPRVSLVNGCECHDSRCLAAVPGWVLAPRRGSGGAGKRRTSSTKTRYRVKKLIAEKSICQILWPSIHARTRRRTRRRRAKAIDAVLEKERQWW
jgi:hypothetical protein